MASRPPHLCEPRPLLLLSRPLPGPGAGALRHPPRSASLSCSWSPMPWRQRWLMRHYGVLPAPRSPSQPAV